MRKLALFVGLISWVFAAQAMAANVETPKTDVQIGLSSETVEIASNFDGTDIVVFGSIENGEPELLAANRYDIVVVLFGPKEEIVVRRKERKLGVWGQRRIPEVR